MPERVALSLDIGGSKFIVGFVDAKGNILKKQQFPLVANPANTIPAVLEAARRALQENASLSPDVVGITIPGLADAKRGLWVDASFSGIQNVPIADMAQKALGLPAFIENDGCACALAERMFGCCRNVDDFFWMTVSNGIGGAVFTQGALYGGVDGNAGEIGHVVVEEGPTARLCKCGLRGCAEIHASGRGLSKNYLSLGGGLAPDGDLPTGQTIATLARDGDPIAREAYALEGYYLGKLAGMVGNLFNPRKIVIGGGVSMAFDLFEEALRETLKKHLYRKANPRLAVEPTALGYHAALLGAAAVGFLGLENPS